MELTRRDAVAALAAAGIGAGGVAFYTSDQWYGGTKNDDTADSIDVTMLRALAEVLYPSEVDATDDFLETYVLGRRRDDEIYYAGIVEGVAALNEHAREQYDASFANLTIQEREDLLQSLGLADARSDPDGTQIERIRYYVVNDFLYALFSTPTGGELVGVENPPGHPGGLAAYQRGPDT